MIALAWLIACMDPNAGTLSQNVGSAFAPCNEAEISFYADKHNFMTAFRPCGNNHFESFAWSPDGKQLYFQLGTEHHVMDAESKTKKTRVVPTPSHVGPATWVSATRLVVPVRPGSDASPDAPNQLAVFDVDPEASSLYTKNLPADLAEIQDVQPSDTAEAVLMSVDRGQGRQIVKVVVATGAVEPGFAWLDADDLGGQAITNFTYTPEQDALFVATGETVRWFVATTGELRRTIEGARRASLHREGRWLMTELLGKPQSVFYQRAWDELPDQARKREQRRAQRFAEQLPDSYETTVRPPTLSFIDLESDRRWRITSVHGDQFAWYPMSLFGSFMMWGFEGKQFRKNVLLGNFATRMLSASGGSTYIGVEPFEGEAPTTEAPTAEAEAPSAEATP